MTSYERATRRSILGVKVLDRIKPKLSMLFARRPIEVGLGWSRLPHAK